MRRALALLACLAVLAVPASPASAAPGEVVVTADGPATTTLTLPASVALDLAHVAFETASPYVVVAAQRGPRVEAWVTRFRDGGSFGSGAALPAGDVTVSVWTDGPATVRIPAPGLGQRLTIRATRRVAALSLSRTVAPDVTGHAESDLAFSVPSARAFVLQTVERPYTVSAARTRSFCVAPAGTACAGEADPRPLLDGGNGLFQVHPTWVLPGALHAFYGATEVAAGGGAARHDLVVLPLA
ncbi:MAG TPA: hypothetical protein VF519_06255 [Mycobacteriales bacterium]|jgi:hypothetical protein